MPRWPGWVLAIGGVVVAFVALVAIELGRQGFVVADSLLLGLIALAGGLAFVAGLVYFAVRQIRIRRALPPERYRGPSVFLLLALALVIGSALTAPFTDDALALGSGEGQISLLGSAVILVAAQLGLLIVGYLFVYRTERARRAAVLPRS